MKLLALISTGCILFLRFQPSKAGTVGRNITTLNTGTIVLDGPPGDNMASVSVPISVNVENSSFTGLNGSHEGPCEQIPEEEPLELVVILKKETKARPGLQDEVNLKLGKDGEPTTEVREEEDGMSIICTADYPIYLEFQLNDGYFTYFFKPDGKYCKCEQEACSLGFKLGIRFPMEVWKSLNKTRLAFTCRSISGRAVMQRKAVLTRSENSNYNVDIITTPTDKLESGMMPPPSNGRASVRIGNCQMDSHGDHGFLTDASEKIPACNDELNMKGVTKPCLTEVNPAKLTGTEDNSFVNETQSPFLDMAVLERMICNFSSTSLRDENTEKPDCNGDHAGLPNQSIARRLLICWIKNLCALLVSILTIAAIKCYITCICPRSQNCTSIREIDEVLTGMLPSLRSRKAKSREVPLVY